MNYRLVIRVIGYILLIEAVLLLFPLAVSLIYAEANGWAYALTMLICAAVGFPMTLTKVKTHDFYAKDGFVIVALSWIVVSVMGCLPFIFGGEIPSFVDALFEMVSGFTTTGATILTDVERLSYSSNFWRCFSHWIGGMGILVFMLAILPMVGGSPVHLLRAESTGPSVEKMTPKLSSTAKHLYLIYISLTVLEFILLVFDMPVYDAIVAAISTAGTGGFSVTNSGAAAFSTYSQIVVTVFMFLFGVNFGLYFLIATGKLRQALKSEELWVYFGIAALSIVAITANLMHFGVFDSLAETVQQTSFQVGTIMSTTGFATTNFDLWPQFSRVLLVLLMFCGSCAGSTAGGMKVSRLIIAAKAVKNDMHSLVHPRSVKRVRLNGKTVSDEVVVHTVRFLLCYLLVYVVSVIVVSFDNFSFGTTMTSVAATLNNIGPGLEMVGPIGNYHSFSVLSKLVMTADMLIGRLEIFPMLILFAPNTWKRR